MPSAGGQVPRQTEAPASASALAIANPKPPSSATPATKARFPVRSMVSMVGATMGRTARRSQERGSTRATGLRRRSAEALSRPMQRRGGIGRLPSSSFLLSPRADARGPTQPRRRPSPTPAASPRHRRAALRARPPPAATRARRATSRRAGDIAAPVRPPQGPLASLEAAAGTTDRRATTGRSASSPRASRSSAATATSASSSAPSGRSRTSRAAQKPYRWNMDLLALGERQAGPERARRSRSRTTSGRSTCPGLLGGDDAPQPGGLLQPHHQLRLLRPRQRLERRLARRATRTRAATTSGSSRSRRCARRRASASQGPLSAEFAAQYLYVAPAGYAGSLLAAGRAPRRRRAAARSSTARRR